MVDFEDAQLPISSSIYQITLFSIRSRLDFNSLWLYCWTFPCTTFRWIILKKSKPALWNNNIHSRITIIRRLNTSINRPRSLHFIQTIPKSPNLHRRCGNKRSINVRPTLKQNYNRRQHRHELSVAAIEWSADTLMVWWR